ncbi:MAG: hypothetical protein VYD19_10575 [Myxococcota bacterium]|nr:hypothetical protein [Myxococcota bacterium]
MALFEGLLYVADAATGRIAAFSPEGGLVDWLDTGAPGIMGITVSPEGELYLVHGPENLLVKIRAREFDPIP